MIYMLKVDALVATAVFGLAGISILILFVGTQAMKYAHALRTMARIRGGERRDSFAISRNDSRNHSASSFRAA